jgi:hypothetical protein
MSDFINRRWVIIPSSDISLVNFNEVLENRIETVRFSNNGEEFFIKFDLAEDQVFPSFIKDSYTVMTYSQIMELLETDNWKAPCFEFPVDGY